MVTKINFTSGSSFDLAPRVDAVQEGHGDVEQNEVGAQSHCGFQQGAAVLHCAHDFATLFDDAAEAFQNQGDHLPATLEGSSCSYGNLRVGNVNGQARAFPRDGVDGDGAVDQAHMRSAMLTKPSPRGLSTAFCVSKPMPSSCTVRVMPSAVEARDTVAREACACFITLARHS